MKFVDSNLAEATAEATIYWLDYREQLGYLMKSDWAKLGIATHMWHSYIIVDTPITARVSSLDNDNKAILFRTLTKWYGDFLVENIQY